jgi:hypothetical protein
MRTSLQSIPESFVRRTVVVIGLDGRCTMAKPTERLVNTTCVMDRLRTICQLRPQVALRISSSPLLVARWRRITPGIGVAGSPGTGSFA